ncbi:tRNA (uridine(34)/cytosine(34)/5-carboxymethylaminomethyluridine(34)-2'-O)-methyltransferase TrmL [Candidatus Endobugula sertula]|uniref:tRNA (cytidine(34)-2'-O)-methyltransferase n=1 Tax=Candidatus Endobugula sertula TaxID=62101 RepID=A0A1D2QNH7_9GAMM|nr:tRNA (uridine(34)/cytosine(34)/5-carboxymethylaminomethyluridine(34)-2'-O)-methyltransferase TrmL [Candidatus Endobugula sertula]
MFNIVLFEPEIPPNTGNIIRLAANTGSMLHIIEPISFELDDKRLRRAGLDYGEWQDMQIYKDWNNFIEQTQPQRLFTISTKGQKFYHDIDFTLDDYLVFGPETRGLPDPVLYHSAVTEQVRIPMTANSRSMNLSNSVSVIVYEAWRQQNFINAT